MGNSSSTGSAPTPAEKIEASDADGSPKRTSAAFRSRSVKADQLCRSLRDQGLCISTSDMNKVLEIDSNIVK